MNDLATYMSLDQYLESELAAFEKHEYYKGQVITLNGVTVDHARIASNILGEIHVSLNDDAEILGSNMRVAIPSGDVFMYPDASIVCGPPQLKPGCFDTLTNPSVIIEVLDPSDTRYDKTYKFIYYSQIPSLKEFILINSSLCRVTSFVRCGDGSWRISTTEDINSTHNIQSIDFNIALSDVYKRVSFNANPQLYLHN